MNVLKLYLSNIAGIEKELDEAWLKVEEAYAEPHRHYHTMNHINQFHFVIHKIANLLNSELAFVLAALYHDIIYDPQKKDNELQSAMYAKQALQKLKLPEDIITKVYNMILATIDHKYANDSDTNYFLDTDLIILGSDSLEYQQYAVNIRKEYAIYDEESYKKGRIEVLSKILFQPHIFKTEFFRNTLEQQARINLTKEIEMHYATS